MFLNISMTTRCVYSRPVELARLEFRVFPASGDWQEVLHLDVRVDPPGRPTDGVDAWGNAFRKIEWDAPLAEWKLTVETRVNTLRENPFDFSAATGRRPVPDDSAWTPDVRGYLHWPYDAWDNDASIETWVRDTVPAGAGAFEKIQMLMRTISENFHFRKGLTDVKTPPGEILRLKVGVCQDFSTLLIAAARSLGLPARYVSGYIYEGPRANRSGPAPAGHGWAEVFFPEIGWKGFDPLNGILACHTHVRTAQGRWYADAAPTIGRFIGPGVEQKTVTEIHVDRADAQGRSIEAAP